MAHVTADRVKDTTTTTGTGDITVSGSAPTGFRTLSAVLTSNGDTCYACIEGGGEWEVCLLTRVSANVYSRGSPLASSNAGAAVNFSAGSKNVFLTLPAAVVDAMITGADGSNGSPHPGLVSGNWYPTVSELPGGGGTTTAGQILFAPFYWPGGTISDLGARVATGQASSNIQIAIYAFDLATAKPTGNALAYTGNISSVSVAPISGDIVGSNVNLAAGWYFAALCCSHNNVQIHYGNHGVWELGAVSIWNLAQPRLGWTYSGTFGTWPDMTGVGVSANTLTNNPAVFLKAA